MASKRRNMFYQNKNQETTEIAVFLLLSTLLCGEYSQNSLGLSTLDIGNLFHISRCSFTTVHLMPVFQDIVLLNSLALDSHTALKESGAHSGWHSHNSGGLSAPTAVAIFKLDSNGTLPVNIYRTPSPRDQAAW
ncbi:hypothetical protein AAG570_008972 [Ranatra chinensis]|uniref:Uncharacterized protein n=1 Tax=Ranatra chinensis TaxID=642074 RepID=A0ABD0YSS1_9HEMI